ncbi:anaerobic ribonucleoside-triphosphate reductase activating protein [Patescibacteria group bacterium]|nr:anaerobic ribonucleoside-triphosphate reductase activating protein [Patescibacteria group bacterium]
MIIGGLQKNTLIDFPGKLACTVFISGCNFFCPWCYSPELVLPEKIKKQPRITEKEVFDFLESRKGLLEGVVICGGEPSMNKDLPELIKKIKKMGFLVKLDTNGSNPEMLEKLIDKKLIDYVAMDIKTPLVFKSQILNPKSQKTPKSQIQKYEKEIKKSVEILRKGKIDFEFRTTAVPTVNKKEDFLEIAKWIGGTNVKYYLQNFRPEKTIDSSFEKIKPYPEEWLISVKKEISPFFKICEIR